MANQREESFTTSMSTFYSRYSAGAVLGKGAFGIVYAGRRLCDDLPVAIKIINSHPTRNPLRKLKEVELMQRVSHIEGVVKLLEACYVNSTLIIIMEKIESSTDMLNYLRSIEDVVVPLDEVKSFFSQMVNTVMECHAAGVIHRDIKPENILVDPTGTLKLIDFGCGSYFQLSYSKWQGTPDYYPPESCAESKKHDGVAATVWSLGTVLYEMLCVRKGRRRKRQLPFSYSDFCNPQTDRTLSFPKEVELPAQCQDLLRKLLRWDPVERISLEEILLHPWMTGVQSMESNQVAPTSSPKRAFFTIGSSASGDHSCCDSSNSFVFIDVDSAVVSDETSDRVFDDVDCVFIEDFGRASFFRTS